MSAAMVGHLEAHKRAPVCPKASKAPEVVKRRGKDRRTPRGLK